MVKITESEAFGRFREKQAEGDVDTQLAFSLSVEERTEGWEEVRTLGGRVLFWDGRILAYRTGKALRQLGADYGD